MSYVYVPQRDEVVIFILSAYLYAEQTHNPPQAIAVELLILCVALYAYLWKTPFFTHGVEVLVYFLPYYFTAALPTGTALNWKRTLPDPVSPMSKIWRNLCIPKCEDAFNSAPLSYTAQAQLKPDLDPAFPPPPPQTLKTDVPRDSVEFCHCLRALCDLPGFGRRGDVPGCMQPVGPTAIQRRRLPNLAVVCDTGPDGVEYGGDIHQLVEERVQPRGTMDYVSGCDNALCGHDPAQRHARNQIPGDPQFLLPICSLGGSFGGGCALARIKYQGALVQAKNDLRRQGDILFKMSLIFPISALWREKQVK